MSYSSISSMNDQTSLLAPLALFLVKRGGNGDRVLFRYPYAEPKTGQLKLGKYRQYRMRGFILNFLWKRLFLFCGTNEVSASRA